MSTIPSYLRWAIEPVAAVLFLLDAIFSEVGRNGWNLVAWTPFIVISVSIGLSRIAPLIAISLPLALVILQYPIAPLRFGDTGWPTYFGLALMLVGVLVSAPRRIRQIAVATVGIGAVLIACLPYLGGSDLVVTAGSHTERIPMALTIATTLFVTALSWILAFGLRAALRVGEADAARRRALAELRGTEDELSMAVQRDRIAQDVHDIMAHSLSVIVAQADGARFVHAKRPALVNQTLEAIAQSARESLGEVRMLIETLISEPIGHSHPRLSDLDALVERMNSAGVSVSVATFGSVGQLTSGQELAIYRIVQEALTNSLKHSGSKPTARVVLDWRGDGLQLNVTSEGTRGNGKTPDGPEPGGAGSRGIYGMRERARLAGGWLTASADEAGNEFLVTAYIPCLPAVSTGMLSLSEAG